MDMPTARSISTNFRTQTNVSLSSRTSFLPGVFRRKEVVFGTTIRLSSIPVSMAFKIRLSKTVAFGFFIQSQKKQRIPLRRNHRCRCTIAGRRQRFALAENLRSRPLRSSLTSAITGFGTVSSHFGTVSSHALRKSRFDTRCGGTFLGNGA
jgi:hypothetical protein